MALDKPTEINLPGFGTVQTKIDPKNYTVKYFKADLNDAGQTFELENIESRGLAGDEIVLINKDKFTFMEKYFVILTYLERKPE